MKTIPQSTPPANTLGNLRIPPTPNSLARLAEYQTQTRWRPGDPLPKNQRPDAHAALARNADALALDEAARQNKVLPFKRKPVPQVIARDGGLEAA
jgi:hypothetical protein